MLDFPCAVHHDGLQNQCHVENNDATSSGRVPYARTIDRHWRSNGRLRTKPSTNDRPPLRIDRARACADSRRRQTAQDCTCPQFTQPARGILYKNPPANNRSELVLADVRHTAVLIGDSQSMPKDSWPQQGIAAMGYKLHVVGMGGTGYVATNGKTGNYIDALQRGDWVLPFGDPPLIVVQGGGNDATQRATDAQITSNAERLLAA